MSAGTGAGSWSRIVAAAVLLGVYAALRTADVAQPVVLAWAAVAALATLAAPPVGWVMVGALAPFTEALTADGTITALPVLAGALSVSVLGRAAFRWRDATAGWPRPALVSIGLAIALLGGTALSLVTTLVRLGPETALGAAQLWATGVAIGLAILVSSALLAREGIWGVAAVVASLTAAAIVSLVDYVSSGAIASGPFGWLLRPVGTVRLTGVIPAPNAAATMFLASTAVLGAAAALGARAPLTGLRVRSAWRAAAAILAAIAVVAVILTFSRSALLALVVVAAIVAWRVRRSVGALLGVGATVVAVAVLLPLALDARLLSAGSVTAGDEERIEGWFTSVRMLVDAPLTGQGFGSFEAVRWEFGSAHLLAPHNEWLRLFAEGGLFVGLLGLLFAASVLVALTQGRSWLGVGILASFAAFATMACFNNPLIYMQVAIPVFTLAGAGLGLVAARPIVMPPPSAPGIRDEGGDGAQDDHHVEP